MDLKIDRRNFSSQDTSSSLILVSQQELRFLAALLVNMLEYARFSVEMMSQVLLELHYS